MGTDTTRAQLVTPDIAAALLDLNDRVRALEARRDELDDDIGTSFKARDFEIEALEKRIDEIERTRRPQPKGEAALAETERAMLELDPDPAYDAAFERLLNSPVDAIGQLLTVGARVTFASGLGKGLEVGAVSAIADNLVLTIDDGTATPWKRAASKVIVLPAGFGS